MFQKLTPRNNSWNRKYDFVNDDGTCFLVEIKNGSAYFGWLSPDKSLKFYKCEEEMFTKNFQMSGEDVEVAIDMEMKIVYLRYPLEM